MLMRATVASHWQLPATEQIGADQLSAVIRAGPAAAGCGFLNAGIVAASLWSAVPLTVLLAWLALTAFVTLSIYFRRGKPRPGVTTLSRRALRRATLLAVVAASPWAVLPALYLGALPHTAELVVITVTAGMAAGGGVLLAPLYPAALAYVATVLVPFACKCLLLVGAGYGLLGLLALSFGAFLCAVIATAARLSVERSEALRALNQSAEMLRERDDTITTQNIRFETALNNMSQGLCFFDGEERLIVCNQRYIEMHGLDPERVRPGTSLSEIVEMRYQGGSCPTISKQEYHAWRSKVARAHEPSETIYKLKDGRTFAIHYRPMADGAWVATTDDITERQRLSDQLAENHKLLAHMATHDPLTDLPNRVLFRERLDAAVEGVRAGRGRVAMIMLDLNKFKHVNDTLGHPMGDSLLRAVADRLTSCVRSEDTVARLGGDEFAILVKAPHAIIEAQAIASRVQAALTTPFQLMDHEVCIGTSIGIAVASGEAMDSDLLIQQADVALYRAKFEAGDRCRLFEAEPGEAASAVRRAS
jgi:diguanylate cyclase (GGDEF)-like protein